MEKDRFDVVFANQPMDDVDPVDPDQDAAGTPKDDEIEEEEAEKDEEESEEELE